MVKVEVNLEIEIIKVNMVEIDFKEHDNQMVMVSIFNYSIGVQIVHPIVEVVMLGKIKED